MLDVEKLKAALATAEGFMSGFEDDEMQEGMDEMLEEVRDAQAALDAFTPEPPARVLVTVSGGVAEVDTRGNVAYELCDFDNLKEEGLDREQREARYQEDLHWLETGTLHPNQALFAADDGESNITDEGRPTQHGEG